MPDGTILLVDDENDVRTLFARILRREGYTVEEAETGNRALDLALSRTPDLVLLDLHLPDLNGLQVLERLLESQPSARVILLTGDGDVHSVVRAMKLGAIDYVLKPLNKEKLVSTVAVAFASSGARDPALAPEIVGCSPRMNEVWAQVACYALPDVSILLLGESGTGKELFARAIHEGSKRAAKPFIALDCANLPDTLVESEIFGHEKDAFAGASERRIGKFEMAHGGTLFLDEIGSLPPTIQAKLLRAVSERTVMRLGGASPVPVDVRIVASTNLDLEHAIRKGTFREDLYYRLAEVVIKLPALRERREDVRLLAEHFVAQFNRRFGRQVKGFDDAAMRVLLDYSWPGNVRELENAVKASLLAADDRISIEHLPQYLRVHGKGFL